MGQSINCRDCSMIETDSPKENQIQAVAQVDKHSSERPIKPPSKRKSPPANTLYILHLSQEKHYVGITTNFIIDFCGESHDKLDWVNLYPVKSFSILKQGYADYNVDEAVIASMRKYGRDNVRGGSYNDINLTTDQIVFLRSIGI